MLQRSVTLIGRLSRTATARNGLRGTLTRRRDAMATSPATPTVDDFALEATDSRVRADRAIEAAAARARVESFRAPAVSAIHGAIPRALMTHGVTGTDRAAVDMAIGRRCLMATRRNPVPTST